MKHPDAQDFLRMFTALGREFSAILTITLSPSLGQAFRRAQEAAENYSGPASIQIIDSHTTAVGLGWIIQCAAKAAADGDSIHKIEHLVRATIPSVYTLFCIPGLTYLAEAGYLSPAQAIIGEMMGLLPIYSIEDDHLTPMEKVRTHRHLLEAFQEFIDEFTAPHHVAIVRGHDQNLRTSPLREYMEAAFPCTPFSEHPMGKYLAAILGPQSVGLIIIE